MHFRTCPQLFALLTVVTLAGACQPEKEGASDTEASSETSGSESSAVDTTGADSSGSETGSSGTDPTVTTGEPLACTPGQTSDGECGNSCICSDDGLWECSEKGCPTLEDGFAATLTDQGGCSDVFLYAVDASATVSVELQAKDLAIAAEQAGVVTTSDFTLPSADLKLVAKTGQDLRGPLCSDFIDKEPTVHLTYTPTAGTVKITIVPPVGDEAPIATAELTDVVWAVESDPVNTAITMPSLIIKDIVVGWLPG